MASILRCWEKFPPAPLVLVLRACPAWPGLGVKQSSRRCWAKEGQAPCAPCADTVTSRPFFQVPNVSHADLCPAKGFCLWLCLLSGKRLACQAAASQPRNNAAQGALRCAVLATTGHLALSAERAGPRLSFRKLPLDASRCHLLEWLRHKRA